MAEFLLLFVGPGAPERFEDDVTRAYAGEWAAWMSELAGHGHLVAGGALQPSAQRVDRDGVTDVKLDRVDVGGYALISADSMELATALAATAPHTKLGGSTIVRPVMAQADVPAEASPHPSD
jgi:hypothetical protein